MDPGLGVWVALNADGLPRSFAGACVGGGALTANRQTAQVPNTAITLYGLEPFQVEAQLAAEITFGDIFALLNGVEDLGELLLVEVLGANRGVDGGTVEDHLGIGRTDPVDVTQSDVNALVTGNIDAEKSWHKKWGG